MDQLLLLQSDGSLTVLELSSQTQRWESQGEAAVPVATHQACGWTVLVAAPSFGDKTGALVACGPAQAGFPNVATIEIIAGDNRTIAVHQTNCAPTSTPVAPERFLDGAFLRGNSSDGDDDVFMLLHAPNASGMNNLVQLSVATLQTTAVGTLLDSRHQSWLSLAAVRLGPIDTQLVLSRTPPNTETIALGDKPKKHFHVDLAVFDSRRDAGRNLSGVRSTHGQVSWLSEYNTTSGHMTRPPLVIPELLSALRSTESTMYQYIIWGNSNDSYLTFVELLDATRDVEIAGQPLQIWADLIPPSESPEFNHSTCSVPANSPLTDFDELLFFKEKDGLKACTEYLAWAEVLGRLAHKYPQLRLVGIDDFTYNIFAYGDRFDPPYIAAFTATLRRWAPWLLFAPTTYFRLEGEELFERMPSLALVLDAPHFPFRGEGMGKCNATAAQPCPVPFPNKCSFCLAGDCGISTIPSAVDDIRSIYAHFEPLGRQIVTGAIATRHSSCGTPSAKYVAATLPVLAAADGVGALYVFRLVAPATNDTSCSSPAATQDKGCIVRNFYRRLSTDVSGSA